jgi:dienelactone hydrolase
VFGLNPQILQGADLLAYGKDGQKFQVFIPDILPEKANPRWFEPEATPEDRAAMGKMFAPGGSGNADVLKASVHKVVEEIKAQGTIEKFAVVGYCWGAKVRPLFQREDMIILKLLVKIDCVLKCR